MTTLTPTIAPEQGFLDWPVVTDPSGWAGEIALFGIRHSEPYAHDPVPNDQSLAPAAIRQRSPCISYGPDQWDFDLDGTLGAILPARCLDCGDFAYAGGDYGAYADQITAAIRHFWHQGAQVCVLGGDHGVTIPVLAALDAVGAPVHVVQIDAHLDWRDEVGGVRSGYSSPMRRAAESAFVSGMTQIGLRQTGSARRGEVEAARAYGAHLFPASAVHAQGWNPVLATIPQGAPVYLTIDADGIDPTEMPGVMGPSPGGFLYREIAPFLRRLAGAHRIVGLDVVEVAPSFDGPNGLTAIMAGRLAVTVLAASAERIRGHNT